MTADDGVLIRRATPDDVDGILALQNANLPDRGGTLSAAFSADWFVDTIADMPVIVAVRDEGIVGFLISCKLQRARPCPHRAGTAACLCGNRPLLFVWPDLRGRARTGSRVGLTDVRRAASGNCPDGKGFCSFAATMPPHCGLTPRWAWLKSPYSSTPAPPMRCSPIGADQGFQNAISWRRRSSGAPGA